MSALLARPRIGFRARLRADLRARLIRLAMLVSVLSLAAGCTSAAPPEAVVPFVGPLVTVQSRGGMCMDGMCDSRVVLERDGRVHDGATPPKELGRVTAEAMTALIAAVQTADYTTLKSKPFTGECPVAFDGQEQIFEFAAPGGTQRLASCEVEIDWTSPLFIALANALGEWIAIPLF